MIKILLFFCLDRNKTGARIHECLANGSGVRSVCFITPTQKCLYSSCLNQLHHMAQILESSRPVMCWTTSLYAYCTGWKIGKNDTTWLRLNFLLAICRPCLSAGDTWKTFFAISSPTVYTFFMAASFLGASLWMTPLGGDDVHQHNHLWKRVYPSRLSYTILCLDLREHRRQTSWPLRRLSKRLLQFYLRLSWLPKRQSLRHPHSWAYGIIRGPELRRGFCLFFDWKRSIIFNEKNSIVHNQLQ